MFIIIFSFTLLLAIHNPCSTFFLYYWTFYSKYILHISEIIQYLSFCIWLILHGIMSSRFIRVVVCISITFYFFETESHSVPQAVVHSNAIMTHCCLNLPRIRWFFWLRCFSLVAGTIRTYHKAQQILVFFEEMGFCYVAQAGLKLLDSKCPLILASQGTGITGVSHRAWP